MLRRNFLFENSSQKRIKIKFRVIHNYWIHQNHLFLRCEVSEHLWTLILRRLGYGRFFFHTWLAFVTWMGDRDSVTPLTLRRLASQATIYTIWTERNSRLHNNVSSSTEALFKKLDRQLKDIILARRNRKAFKGLLQLWLATE
ncbi:hypothetical protein Bca52824_025641 [Brassica carinata]|uniref:Reverse transcriptase zinc-binding domain-containing protein n=1 Tax=Brassica carinata TaxID=52824 RepID=A0A8X7SGL6_BRACI|nr:hypothetical protein Bca52824_025641 [Brassica carinata]